MSQLTASEKRPRTLSLDAAMDELHKDEKDFQNAKRMKAERLSMPPQGRIAERRAEIARLHRMRRAPPAGKSPAPGLAAVAAPPGLAAVYPCSVCAGSCHGQYACSKKIFIDYGLPFMLEVDVDDWHLGGLA